MGGQVPAYNRGETRIILIATCKEILKLEHKKAELAVHKRKVEDVRRWLLEAFEGGPSAKLRKYRVRACASGNIKTEHMFFRVHRAL